MSLLKSLAVTTGMIPTLFGGIGANAEDTVPMRVRQRQQPAAPATAPAPLVLPTPAQLSEPAPPSGPKPILEQAPKPEADAAKPLVEAEPTPAEAVPNIEKSERDLIDFLNGIGKHIGIGEEVSPWGARPLLGYDPVTCCPILGQRVTMHERIEGLHRAAEIRSLGGLQSNAPVVHEEATHPFTPALLAAFNFHSKVIPNSGLSWDKFSGSVKLQPEVQPNGVLNWKTPENVANCNRAIIGLLEQVEAELAAKAKGPLIYDDKSDTQVNPSLTR
jgi:hypothetical protein